MNKLQILLFVVSGLTGTGGLFWLYLHLRHDPVDTTSKAGGRRYMRCYRQFIKIGKKHGLRGADLLSFAHSQTKEMWALRDAANNSVNNSVNEITSTQTNTPALPWWRRKWWRWKRGNSDTDPPPA